jgi:hypothetical protein
LRQEAAEIDAIFGNSFDSGFLQNYLSRFSISSLSPKFTLNVPTYSESKSNIANLRTPQHKSIFQDMFYRAFSYLWIKNNPALKGESYQRLANGNNKAILAQTSSSPVDGNGFHKRHNGGGIPAIDSIENNPLTNSKDFSVTNALFKCTMPSVQLINMRTKSLPDTATPSDSLTDINEGIQ